MKKIWKHLAVIVSIVCLTLTCALFAACGDPVDDGTATYTVTVVAPDGTTPVQGVEIAFCDPIKGVCNKAITTDANGVVTFSGEKKNYHVQVNAVPAGYSAGEYYRTDSTCYTDDWNGTSFTMVLEAA